MNLKRWSNLKIYLSGAISDMPDDNREMFERAEIWLKEQDLEVVNPLKLDHSKSEKYTDYLKTDIKHMMDCDAIYMLNGWRESNGARIENDLARKLTMAIIYETY